MINQNPWTFAEVVDRRLSEMTKDNEYELLKAIPPHRSLPPYQLFTDHYTINDEINFKALCRGETIRVHFRTEKADGFFKRNILFFTRMEL